MNVTHKTLGLSVIALAAALFTTATLAETMGPMGDRMGLIAADTDKDGKISKAEFEAWRTARITVIDTDKDGLLSADELAAARMKEAETRSKAMAARMIAMHDQNGDGKLSAEELMSAPTPVFDALDTNADGAVDKAELDAFRTEHGPMEGRGMGNDMGDGPGDGMGMGDGMMGKGHHGHHGKKGDMSGPDATQSGN